LVGLVGLVCWLLDLAIGLSLLVWKYDSLALVCQADTLKQQQLGKLLGEVGSLV